MSTGVSHVVDSGDIVIVKLSLMEDTRFTTSTGDFLIALGSSCCVWGCFLEPVCLLVLAFFAVVETEYGCSAPSYLPLSTTFSRLHVGNTMKFTKQRIAWNMK